MFVALAGGVGGARLAYGLDRALAPGDLVVAVNTGDDFEHLGLFITPDIDTVCYTLAELDDQERGWGLVGESWNFMTSLKKLGGEGWFQLGDGDLAKHVLRTQMRKDGKSLTAITAHLAAAMGIGSTILPMSDDPVPTIIETVEGRLAFQHYFVREQCRPAVRGFDYAGAAEAKANPDLIAALADPALEGVIICPSNPWLSIGPILAIPAIREALAAVRTPRIVVSPIVGGKAIKGPAAKLMGELGLEVSAHSIARHYAGIVDAIVIDNSDAALAPAIEELGLRVLVTDTIMHQRPDRTRLAETLLKWAVS
jgi:LPPG:FO 2-phospho-L-lactate transferase